MIYHNWVMGFVMLVEIPDPEVILGVIVAFLIGLFGWFLYSKVKPFIHVKRELLDPSYLERFEYYEKQLIDMKIRLDATDMEALSVKSIQSTDELDGVIEHLNQETQNVKEKKGSEELDQSLRTPNMGYNNAIDYVLKLITDKPMTSRDIQITVGRSREHTSRLMKKLFEEGFVKRNTSSKPYTYSITEKGENKIGGIETAISLAF